MNEISKGADFAICYGEESAGCNEREISYNPEDILNEMYEEIGLKKEDLVKPTPWQVRVGLEIPRYGR